MGPFFFFFLVSVSVFFCVFQGVRGGLRNLFFLVLGAVLLLFPSGFLCAFLFVFSLLFGLFGVPFWLWVLGAALLFFPSAFLCAFLFVFSLLFGLFWFLALGAKRRAALFSVGLFVCVFVCVFSFFRAFLGSFFVSKTSHCAVNDDTWFHEPDGNGLSECDRAHECLRKHNIEQRPSDTTKTRQFLTPRLDARLHACASLIYQNLSADSLQSSVIDLRALLARWKDTHDLRMLKPSTIHPCIHHPINNVAPRITGPTKNAIIIPEDKLICTSSRT